MKINRRWVYMEERRLKADIKDISEMDANTVLAEIIELLARKNTVRVIFELEENK